MTQEQIDRQIGLAGYNSDTETVCRRIGKPAPIPASAPKTSRGPLWPLLAMLPWSAGVVVLKGHLPGWAIAILVILAIAGLISAAIMICRSAKP